MKPTHFALAYNGRVYVARYWQDSASIRVEYNCQTRVCDAGEIGPELAAKALLFMMIKDAEVSS
ncbi:hypothetical protein [Chthonobacter albigriseus]|uniref:hypothetical protein n=1 Tax=Chthonobacter albigriseus TaxID=1683161 RepID=UPI0015EFB0EF|nr:hypothetical protein [Chthonobacter albigriseus]